MTAPVTEASALPPSQSLPAGSLLEEFVIERVLGSGGFGITYLARDKRLGRQVVIKENLPTQFCWRDTHSLTVRPRHTKGEDAGNFQYSMESFEREASTLASLDHPGIVKVLRSFEAHGTAYFVMPFVEGIALDEVIRQRTSQGNPFTEAEIKDLLVKVLDALGYLHERGIYHRDIKPGNILMTKAGPVLIDFGAARQRLSEHSLTVIESAGYTPFEQLQSRGKVGPWSDLYALGGTLFKLVAGETPAKATDRIMDDPVVPLAERPELRGNYSSRMLETIDLAMSPQLSGRLQNTSEWLAAMTAHQNVAPSQVLKPPRISKRRPIKPLPLATVQTPLLGGSSNAEKHNRRKTLIEYSFAIFIAGLFLICILLLLRSPSSTAPPQPSLATATAAPSTQQITAQAETGRLAKGRADADQKARQMAAEQPERKRMAAQEEVQKQKDAALVTALNAAGKIAPFSNSLGMKFVPAGTPDVLFSVWETRLRDFEAFVNHTGYDAIGDSTDGSPSFTLEMGAEWKQSGGSWKDPHFPTSQTSEQPVVCVSYRDCEHFCVWLTQKEHGDGIIPTDAIYRLPTDAEWSRACDGSEFPWGDTFPPGSQVGNYCGKEALIGGLEGAPNDLVKWDYKDSVARTAPVGRFAENRFGLHDIGGNVYEWCSTWYTADLNDAETLKAIPALKDDKGGRTYRVLRGASWCSDLRVCMRSSYREYGVPGRRRDLGGFRVVLVLTGG